MIKTWQERIVTANPPYVDPEEINKAMLEEIDELREAFANLHSDYDIIEIDREELRAKLAALDAQEKLAALEVLYLNSLADATQWQLYKSRKDAVIAAGMGKKAMRDSAAGAAPVQRMTGAALASQEPVAEVLLVDGEKVIDASMAFFDSVELGTKLYLAAGAASDLWL